MTDAETLKQLQAELASLTKEVNELSCESASHLKKHVEQAVTAHNERLDKLRTESAEKIKELSESHKKNATLITELQQKYQTLVQQTEGLTKETSHQIEQFNEKSPETLAAKKDDEFVNIVDESGRHILPDVLLQLLTREIKTRKVFQLETFLRFRRYAFEFIKIDFGKRVAESEEDLGKVFDNLNEWFDFREKLTRAKLNMILKNEEKTFEDNNLDSECYYNTLYAFTGNLIIEQQLFDFECLAKYTIHKQENRKEMSRDDYLAMLKDQHEWINNCEKDLEGIKKLVNIDRERIIRQRGIDYLLIKKGHDVSDLSDLMKKSPQVFSEAEINGLFWKIQKKYESVLTDIAK
eukprot:CAMPEP_0176438428 /NCGR_PEP_ID=MMETSP0127-20121128/19276_1 /TAXON_ID=938130 /ORGANISM="Platyophrya macrostoma, Strain WH" /LENGTH=350 /DNA_ID=CAMNT_0017822373 /DNA_START=22 /DNA_END=1074 /DNA_ORIENTATION=-